MYRLRQARAFQKPRSGLRNATAPAGKCVGLRLEGFGKQPRWAWFRGVWPSERRTVWKGRLRIGIKDEFSGA